MNPRRHVVLQGPHETLTSCSLINRRLIPGLRGCGYTVSVFGDSSSGSVDSPLPDLYLFHGYPFDARSAPGALNVFILDYEYLSLERQYRALVARLNAAFDVVVVPARFLRRVLREAGLRIPVEVVPWAVDADEFGPSTAPETLPTSKTMIFLHLGAVNGRKGTDVLLKAFCREFTAREDVALVIKEAMRHPGFEPWTARLQRRYLRPDRDRPEIRWILQEAASVAGYYTAAHVGVFPHRGEGFGLPILECIASGRPVIVTGGTGPDDFCTRRNSWRLRARRTRVGTRLQLEPDPAHLQQLLRRAFERGPIGLDDQTRISETARAWSWERTITRLDSVLRTHWSRRGAGANHARRRPLVRRRPAMPAASPIVAYAFFEKGGTSWKKVCREVDRSLAARFARYRPISHVDRFDAPRADVFVGLSEFCLERLVKAREANPDVLAIVHQECTVLGDRLAILNAERAICGLPPVVARPIDLWRNAAENRLADAIVVASSVARRFFLRNGFPASKIHSVPFGMRLDTLHVRRGHRTTRFLFIGTDAIRKGIRLLFEAWSLAKLPHAELICHTDLEPLRSPLLLKYLVAHPNIIVRGPASYADFLREYDRVDCQVLPSLEDSFSLSIGDGMGRGKPAIVSTHTGIQDLIRHGVNGYVVEAGNAAPLAEAMTAMCENPARRRAMGRAAYETAREFSWSRFRRTLTATIDSLYAAHRA